MTDLEEAWNEMFQADFGLSVPEPSLGFLQDVHWSLGLFGYFPTYTLGNLYAASLWTAINAAIPNRDQLIESGNFGEIRQWLHTNIHRHGRILTAPALIEKATGKAMNPDDLGNYLEAKFTRLYRS